jgi:hypothetical protein
MTPRTKIAGLAASGALALALGAACTSSASRPDGGAPAVETLPDGGICAPDDASCGVDPQCGCPSGQKCDFAPDAGTATCVNAGVAVSGTACSAVGDCAAGLTCVEGVCRPFCPESIVGSTCAAPASGPAPGLCVQPLVNAVAIPQDAYCFFDCTPVPNDCPAGQGCIITAVDGINYPDCQAAGSVAPGGACTADSSCAAGSICYQGDAAASVCLQLCLTAKDCASLGATFQCNTSIGSAVNGVLYGLCAE